MIEINKIRLGCLEITGQVIYYKVMMVIHRKNMVGIILQVVKMIISKQQQ